VRATRAIGVIGLSCVLGLGCAASGNYVPESYVVQPHDTLYSIAWRLDLDYHDLARWNNLGPDYRISIGQVLLLKSVAPQAAVRPAVPAPRSSQSAGSHPRDADTPPGAASSFAPGAAPNSALQWVWPTERLSAPREVPGGGILLLGQLGQVIRAACTGRVVYIGSGLRAYGNLIIIKHGDNLLSAYAHNSELLVHEGQDVQGGQPIARMGEGPHQVAALYFEIRRNGKPVDPLPYLSAIK
jgi:lipoprotein NlpD